MRINLLAWTAVESNHLKITPKNLPEEQSERRAVQYATSMCEKDVLKIPKHENLLMGVMRLFAPTDNPLFLVGVDGIEPSFRPTLSP